MTSGSLRQLRATEAVGELPHELRHADMLALEVLSEAVGDTARIVEITSRSTKLAAILEHGVRQGGQNAGKEVVSVVHGFSSRSDAAARLSTAVATESILVIVLDGSGRFALEAAVHDVLLEDDTLRLVQAFDLAPALAPLRLAFLRRESEPEWVVAAFERFIRRYSDRLDPVGAIEREAEVIRSASSEIDELRRRVEKLRRQVRQMERSVSWRITRPLRLVSSLRRATSAGRDN